MFNLAGRKDCDKFIEVELESAGYEPIHIPDGCKHVGEVGWSVYSEFRGWKLTRAWSYWVAVAKDPIYWISQKEAEEFNSQWGKEVRYDGFAGGTKAEKDARLYHIDTENGLRQFRQFLNKRTDGAF